MKVLLYIIIILIIAALIVVSESIREHKKFNVKTYKITNDKVPDTFKNTRIVMLSDLHNACYGKDNEVLYNRIKELKPDFIIIAGDMPVANSENKTLNFKTAEFIVKISDIADIYYGVGNHERRMLESVHLKKDWIKYQSILNNNSKNKKIYYMDNKRLSVSKGGKRINIFGLDLELAYYQRFSKKNLSEAEIIKNLGRPDKEEYNILIAHNPEFFESYVEWGADLILSGHIHGGMVRLPFIGGVVSPKPRLFPHYDYGEYKKDNTIMILSGGLGSHSIKLRLNNVPELILIEL